MSRFLAAIGEIRVVTESGDFYVGTAGNDVLKTDATVVGLAGMAGDDRLTGGAGRDLLLGDYFSADWFNDSFEGPPVDDLSIVGNDKLYGGVGKDVLIGGPGLDSLYGGLGDDYYGLFGGGADLLVEGLDGGVDTITTSAATFTLPENFENLEFSNMFTELRKDVHGIGNAAANAISGGLRNDILEGLAGNDTLAGGQGRDVLTGGTGRDSFAFGFGAFGNGSLSTGDNADTITDFNPVVDQILLDFFSFNQGPGRPIKEGVIRAAQFGLIDGVLTGKEKVLYDPTSGDLMTKDHSVFAHVAAGTVLTYHDFEWSYGNWGL
jgi:Ca2+-binding RTX toxin-like protein